MLSINKIIGAGLLSGGILAGAPSYAEGSETAEAMAVRLGIPFDGAALRFWNAATQSSGRIACTIPDPAQLRCSVSVSSAGAQMDYAVTQTFTSGDSVSVSTVLDRAEPWQGDFRTTTDYVVFYESSTSHAWGAGNPLAVISPDGMVVQNDVKEVRAQRSASVDIRSVVPVGDDFGLEITNSFDGAAGIVQSFVMPRIRLADGTVLSGSVIAEPASRSFSGGDDGVLESNRALAERAGGTAYKKTVVQPPAY